ncbi:MAG: alpha/beta hydrolase [Pseudomonadota bacterium]
MTYKKGYVDGRYGQLHFHSAFPESGADDKTPVAFFHQNPKSADDFRPLLEIIGNDRLAIAIDLPGYGESEPMPHAPSMRELADAMADALDAMGYGGNGKGAVDAFGFHTGVLVASELAIVRPDLVRRVVLCGIPYLSPEARAVERAKVPTEFSLPEDPGFIVKRWHLIVTQRPPTVPLERAARSFVEDLHSLDKWWYAYHAVWDYPVEERLPLIRQPVLILAAHEMLYRYTVDTKRDLLPDATLIDMPDVVDDIFDTAPDALADAMRPWLDQT